MDGLLDVAGAVAANTANIPQLQATAPVLAQIVDEAVVQDGYMNALTDGYGERMSNTHLLILLSVHPRGGGRRRARARADRGPPRLARSPTGLATLAGALQGVEEEHLRPLEPAVKAINAQFDIILGALPGIARKAAVVAERRPR